MDKGDRPTTRPCDRHGRKLRVYDLCIVNEVPSYMLSAYVGNHPGEMSLVERIKSLSGRIGLIIPPDSAPDLSWHSRDLDHVNLRCKLVDDQELHGKAAIWTYEQYFPTNVLSRTHNNIFLRDVLLHPPHEFDTVDVIGDEQFTYMASVLHAKGKALADLHDWAVRTVLDKLIAR